MSLYSTIFSTMSTKQVIDVLKLHHTKISKTDTFTDGEVITAILEHADAIEILDTVLDDGSTIYDFLVNIVADGFDIKDFVSSAVTNDVLVYIIRKRLRDLRDGLSEWAAQSAQSGNE